MQCCQLLIMLILLTKIIVTPFAIVEGVCRTFTAFLLWDERPMKGEWLMDIIWKKD